MESDQGDSILSPAYDLLCTIVYINDSDICMRDGLYEGDYNESDFKIHESISESFLLFADKLNRHRQLSKNIIDELIT